MKILLIEDLPLMREAVQRILERGGHTVTAAAHGGHGISYLRRETFDAVVSDLQMPVADGRRALRFCQEEGLSTPVIILTAETSAEKELRALGAVAVIAKGMDSAEALLEVLAQIVPTP